MSLVILPALYLLLFPGGLCLVPGELNSFHFPDHKFVRLVRTLLLSQRLWARRSRVAPKAAHHSPDRDQCEARAPGELAG